MNHLARRAALLTLASVLGLTPGCSHVAVVSVDPTGSDVSLDGVSLGQAMPEVEISSSYGLPGGHELAVAHQGFRPKKLTIRRGYHADLSLLWLLAGLVPYVFTARLDDHYPVELDTDVPEALKPDGRDPTSAVPAPK